MLSICSSRYLRETHDALDIILPRRFNCLLFSAIQLPALVPHQKDLKAFGPTVNGSPRRAIRLDTASLLSWRSCIQSHTERFIYGPQIEASNLDRFAACEMMRASLFRPSGTCVWSDTTTKIHGTPPQILRHQFQHQGKITEYTRLWSRLAHSIC